MLIFLKSKRKRILRSFQVFKELLFWPKNLAHFNLQLKNELKHKKYTIQFIFPKLKHEIHSGSDPFFHSWIQIQIRIRIFSNGRSRIRIRKKIQWIRNTGYNKEEEIQESSRLLTHFNIVCETHVKSHLRWAKKV